MPHLQPGNAQRGMIMSTNILDDKRAIFVNEDGEVVDQQAYLDYLGITPGFQITRETLDWYLKRRAAKVAMVATVDAQFKKALNAAKSDLASFEFIFAKDAEQVAREMLTDEGKLSVVTPWGTIKTRKVPGGLVVDNEDQIQTHIRFLSDKDKEKFGVKPTVFTRNLELLKKECKDPIVDKDGNIIDYKTLVPGIKWKPESTSFSITYAKKED